MFRNATIKTKLFTIILGAMILITTLLLMQAIRTINTISDEKIKEYKEEAYKTKEEELSNYLSIALSTIDAFYQRSLQEESKGTEGNATVKLQKEALLAVSKMRYGKDGYFWINDMQPKMIMHPMQPSLDGKDLSGYKDPNGVYLFNEMVRICKQSDSGGLVKYAWAKPNQTKPQPKFSYVKRFKGWDWIIGTGAYVDDIVKKIDTMKQETQKELHLTIRSFVIKSLLVMIVIIFFINTIVKKEVEKNLEQERSMAESAKLAQMGEMMGNIAHQWRQPLSIISTISTGTIAQHKMGILNDESLIDNMNKINDFSQYLSETINIFRNFLKEKKVLKQQTIQENIRSAVSIVEAVLKDVNIQLIDEVDYDNPITVTIVSGELPQVIINIINNAKDIILERNIENGWIKLSLHLQKKKQQAIITVEDNAGGIPEEVLPRIFDPYFTTKHQSVGTGLGLHMSKRIVQESLKGNLYAKNSEHGGIFFIEIPL